MNYYSFEERYRSGRFDRWDEELPEQENCSQPLSSEDDCRVGVSTPDDIEDIEDYDCDQEENLESEYDDEECGQCYGRMDDLGLSWRDFC